MSLEYVALEQLAIVLVSFRSGGICEELYSSQHVDLREENNLFTTPHSTYYCDICILYVVKVIPTILNFNKIKYFILKPV